MTNFCSDNTAGASPEILEALAAAAREPAMPYGNDPFTERLTERLREVFEHDLAVYPVATGTAANALALSALSPPYGAVYCHVESHVNTDECGAPELFSGGAKLIGLDGGNGRIGPAELEAALRNAPFGVVHHVQPAVLSLTQATEAGTVYDLEHLSRLTGLAHDHGLTVHLDGARFANALVHLGCSPAAASWQAGIDVLCLGATKDGAFAAETVLFFDPEKAVSFPYLRKRGGHLLSKLRFISAQLDAWLADDLWLRNARHANVLARRMANGLARLPEARILYPVEANEIFVSLPEQVISALESEGFGFYRWPAGGDGAIRLVLSFDSAECDVDTFISAATRAAG